MKSKVTARILIAEDDDVVRKFLMRALGSDGHILTEAADGASAFAALNQSEGKFDLLLADVKMPMMDGILLAMETGRNHPDFTGAVREALVQRLAPTRKILIQKSFSKRSI